MFNNLGIYHAFVGFGQKASTSVELIQWYQLSVSVHYKEIKYTIKEQQQYQT